MKVICDHAEKCDLTACDHHYAHDEFFACLSEDTCFKLGCPVKCVEVSAGVKLHKKKGGKT